jgi:hypothetical protein
MDKDDLNTLLSSGKFLIFKPSALAPKEGAKASRGPDGPGPALFDLALLQQAVFFKEAAVDEDDEIETSTRVMLSFDEKDPLQGGVSSPAHPETLIPALAKWYGGMGQIEVSDHDRTVLEALCRVPTFDPFILLAFRPDLERARAIHPAYFDVDRATSEGVHRVIERRASRLVKLALSMEGTTRALESADDSIEVGDGPSVSRQRSVTLSLADAIWSPTGCAR